MTDYQETSALAREGRAAVGRIAAWWTAASEFIGAIRAYGHKRRTYIALMNLDNRTLKDIGLDRSEIMSISYGDSNGHRRRNIDR